MRDFTIKIFIQLLEALKTHNARFLTFEQSLKPGSGKSIILRHDVDDLKANSLVFAKIERDLGIIGTYNFRITPESFDEKIIREIFSMGHEIGYHYEEMGTTAQRHNGTMAKGKSKGYTTHDARLREEELAGLAIDSFRENLGKLRKIVPVNTICMHGSPRSRWIHGCFGNTMIIKILV